MWSFIWIDTFIAEGYHVAKLLILKHTAYIKLKFVNFQMFYTSIKVKFNYLFYWSFDLYFILSTSTP